MEKAKKKKKANRSLPQHFRALGTYMNKVARGSLARHTIYSLCVKASVSKCYEFNLTISHTARHQGTFFAMSALRGICEDLIVLRFIGKIPPKDRAELLSALSGIELGTRIKQQGIFFSLFRPQQPVLRLKDVDAGIGAAEAAARAVWNRHGWPNLKKGAMPPIRQIAEKQGWHQLAVLYDYLYRLTSAGVHFGVQSLLRSGWGPTPNDFIFSAKNFHPYFEEYCRLYGAFMFCLYFEFFVSVLRPSPTDHAIIAEIRQHVLFTPRWPEMVTFEEMNQKPPEGGQMLRMLVSAFQSAIRPRLITKGANYTNKRSSERKFVREALQVIAAGMAADRRDRGPSANTNASPATGVTGSEDAAKPGVPDERKT
jgi:hypothetical protein